MSAEWWHYDNLPTGEPYDWAGAERGEKPLDNLDFHLDIGCGVVKKGRLGIDRFYGPGVDLVVNLETLSFVPLTFEGPGAEYEEVAKRGFDLYNTYGSTGRSGGKLPFPSESIESIISHHCLEHIGSGFLRLMDECYRILKPGGVFRIIVPLFPSKSAVEDPDHKRYFMKDTFETFCGTREGDHWHESFSRPYTACRFEMVERDYTSAQDAIDPVHPEDGVWGDKGARELRVTLRKWPKQ